MGGHVAFGWERERRSAYRALVGKPERKTPLGRPRHRREDNMELYLQKHLGAGAVDWIGLTQDRDTWWGLVRTVMNLRVP
jgi:hypothetical protein